MEAYLFEHSMKLLEEPLSSDAWTLILLSSDELVHAKPLPGVEAQLHHMPLARDARGCKAEMRRDCLCGTVFTPRKTKDGKPISFGYLLTGAHLVLCDDSGVVRTIFKRLPQEKQHSKNGAGWLLCALLEQLLLKDSHHLEEIEEQLGQLEDQVLAGDLDKFGPQLTEKRKETMKWFHYYAQLNDMVCELEEDEFDFFSDGDHQQLRMLEKRLVRLQDGAQSLREYCLQIRELFQAQVDIRQNRIMQILTVVTTLCLPLSLVAGWYGMNFYNMPELRWQYGYPVVILVSVVIVIVSLVVMKKKKFW